MCQCEGYESHECMYNVRYTDNLPTPDAQRPNYYIMVTCVSYIQWYKLAVVIVLTTFGLAHKKEGNYLCVYVHVHIQGFPAALLCSLTCSLSLSISLSF